MTQSTVDYGADNLKLTASAKRRLRQKRLTQRKHAVAFLAQIWPGTVIYRYENFRKSKDEIRLLTLVPGKFSEPVRVTLQITPFDPNEPPVYEALSYTWGSTDVPVPLAIGQSTNETISITRNLAAALPHLRYRNRPRILWIDAICINQLDLAERSEQVQLMGDIYKSAVRVIAWIGAESDNSSLALDILESVGMSLEVDWITFSMRSKFSDTTCTSWADESQEIPLKETEMRAVVQILQRPWFTRLWVQQEVRLGAKAAVLVCGSKLISWQAFCKVMFALRVKPYQRGILPKAGILPVKFNHLVDLIASMCMPIEQRDFGDRVDLANKSICSDPRDKVYALLSIQEQGGYKLDVVPNYAASVPQVYMATTLQVLKQSCDTNILRSCELRADGNYFMAMPSWVPDFSIPKISRGFSDHRAGGSLSSVWSQQPSNTLRVRGMSVSSLESIQNTMFVAADTYGETLTKIQRLRPQTPLNSTYICGITLLDAYCEAFGLGEFAERSVPQSYDTSYETSLALLNTIWEPDTDLYELESRFGTRKSKAYLKEVIIALKKRTLSKTKQGYIVLGPQAARTGDEVCVLAGCTSCMLLRPAGEQQWTVVGECYVPGLMEGEALAGPFPKGFRCVKFLRRCTGDWTSGFQSTVTGEVQEEDPRFEVSEYPDVGAGISIDYWSNSRNRWRSRVHKIKCVSDLRRLEHPWREENLLRRGVELRDFDLI